MTLAARAIAALALLASPLRAETAGEFDYYVVSLSWSPGWCAREGDARGSAQCDEDRDLGWVLHGLWPQYETGWPDYCDTGARPPSRRDTGAMADIMGTGGSAWHQWKKHGTCSGLSSETYFDTARAAFAQIERPEEFRRLNDEITLPAAVVEQAFLRDNPDLSADGLTVTCREGMVQEVRICLTRDLAPRDCGADVIRDCALSDALMLPIR
ncbi:ribonuclease T2 family protein [Limimaricola hongkongensis]|uniref:Ribonuclease T2 family protein n=1 Tax=Limimaricola hongkongensis DSM 17492 TaxID=1122180 RepID=A0A017HE12_9RHOB|nr:ribonuclease T2 [Limimaricola hongkongensis]EYD72581.1 Ribonuclease T2 family protein [Limimaricola hongkongensis DSM 17492]